MPTRTQLIELDQNAKCVPAAHGRGMRWTSWLIRGTCRTSYGENQIPTATRSLDDDRMIGEDERAEHET